MSVGKSLTDTAQEILKLKKFCSNDIDSESKDEEKNKDLPTTTEAQQALGDFASNNGPTAHFMHFLTLLKI